jgi:hypothetical protein
MSQKMQLQSTATRKRKQMSEDKSDSSVTLHHAKDTVAKDTVAKDTDAKDTDRPDQLAFMSTSADKLPGQGVREHVKNSDMYLALGDIPNWRQKLSNFAKHTFEHRMQNVPGHPLWGFDSIEAAFQAEKIALVDVDKARLFTTVATGGEGWTGQQAQSKRKLVVLSKSQLAVWNEMSQRVMTQCAQERFATDLEGQRILRATRNAQLVHILKRSKLPPVRFVHLEDIRAKLE